MKAQGQSRARLLLKAAGAAAVLGTSKLMLGGTERSPRQPRYDKHDSQKRPDDDAHSKRIDLVTYGIGYVLALVLTFSAFALVHWRWASGTTALSIIFALALIQAIVHFRCFLHVSLGRSSSDDLQLILFSTLIIAAMAGGTLVVLFNLRMRMM